MHLRRRWGRKTNSIIDGYSGTGFDRPHGGKCGWITTTRGWWWWRWWRWCVIIAAANNNRGGISISIGICGYVWGCIIAYGGGLLHWFSHVARCDDIFVMCACERKKLLWKHGLYRREDSSKLNKIIYIQDPTSFLLGSPIVHCRIAVNAIRLANLQSCSLRLKKSIIISLGRRSIEGAEVCSCWFPSSREYTFGGIIWI